MAAPRDDKSREASPRRFRNSLAAIALLELTLACAARSEADESTKDGSSVTTADGPSLDPESSAGLETPTSTSTTSTPGDDLLDESESTDSESESTDDSETSDDSDATPKACLEPRQGLLGTADRHEVWLARAMKTDGETLLAWAPHDRQQGRDSGAVLVFERRPDGALVGTQKLVDIEGRESGAFGRAMAVDGDWIAAWSGYTPGERNPSSSVHLFRRNREHEPEGAAGWIWHQTLTRTTVDVEGFGAGRDLAFVAGQLLVSGGTSLEPDGGEVIVFELDGDEQWRFVDRFYPSQPDLHGAFGAQMVVHGERLFVSSPGRGTLLSDLPDILEFARVDGTWVEQAELHLPKLDYSEYSPQVFAVDDPWLFVNDPRSNADEVEAVGRVHVFRREGDGWRAHSTIESPLSDPYTMFGDSLAAGHGQLWVYQAREKTVDGLTWRGAVERYTYDPGDDRWQRAETIDAPQTISGQRYGHHLLWHERGELYIGWPQAHDPPGADDGTSGQLGDHRWRGAFERWTTSPDGTQERQQRIWGRALGQVRGFGAHIFANQHYAVITAIDPESGQGRVRLHPRLANGSWSETGRELVGGGYERIIADGFGTSAAKHDGFIVVGTPAGNGGAGRVHMFDREYDSVNSPWNFFPDVEQPADVRSFGRALWLRDESLLVASDTAIHQYGQYATGHAWAASHELDLPAGLVAEDVLGWSADDTHLYIADRDRPLVHRLSLPMSTRDDAQWDSPVELSIEESTHRLTSVSVFDTTMVVGAPARSDAPSETQGSALLLEREPTGAWRLVRDIRPADAHADFGGQVLTGARVIVVGSRVPGEDMRSAAIDVYRRDPALEWGWAGRLANDSEAVERERGRGLALVDGELLVGSPHAVVPVPDCDDPTSCRSTDDLPTALGVVETYSLLGSCERSK